MNDPLINLAEKTHKEESRHSHYFREWKGEKLDFYFIMTLFGVTDPCITHAMKKLMFAGVRGAKGEEKDLNEAIDSIRRRLELMKSFEENNVRRPVNIDPSRILYGGTLSGGIAPCADSSSVKPKMQAEYEG